MITPAYSPTATERVLPRMALDFTTGVLDPRVTVTRALNTATRINSSGLVEVVNANLPRFDYDPTTLAPKGLLIEESRTNQLTYSEDFSDASWVKSAGGAGSAPVVTANYATAPNGTMTADRVVFTLNGGTSINDFSALQKNVGSGTQSTSVWLKTTDGSTVSVALRNATFSVLTVTGVWQRFLLENQASTNNFQLIIRGTYGTSSSADILVWGAQLESGTFATSYIPNLATGTTTRNADAVTMTGTNFSDWYNASEGTFAAQYSSIAATAATTKAIASANDGTGNNRIYMYITNTAAPAQLVIDGGATQANPLNTAIANNTVTKSVMGYKVNNFGVATNGAAAVVDTVGTVPNVNTLGIGSHTSIQQLNGWAQKLNYYPQKLTSAEIQAFSK